MARKLYIFGIGGTGSRVIKALTMLFASGVKLDNNFDTVVPIIIDPDTGNGDLNRTKEILTLYQQIRNEVKNPDDFFVQELNTISNILNNKEAINGDSFQFHLNGTANNKFKNFINYGSLSDDDKKFISQLYSKSNLESDLDVGFKGNPNMGSIVLNQFTSSNDFQKFGQSFAPDDAIFIVNSIFGGTGAAGFPLLLKSLKNGANIPKSAQIRKAKVGGITYLPYFELEKGEIDSDSFYEKSKAAIDYYNRTIIDTNSIDLLYFIGDRGNKSTYENHVGKKEQKNDAHFLELAGALAVLDFCKNGVETDQTKTIVKEFGIENENYPLTFNSLNKVNSDQIKTHLLKYKLFTEYLNNGLSRALNVSRWTKNAKFLKKKSNLTKNYFQGSYYQNQIIKFNSYFDEWTLELERNRPSFAPFKEIIENPDMSKELFKPLDTSNCQNINNSKYFDNKRHNQLIKLFQKSTEQVINKRIK